MYINNIPYILPDIYQVTSDDNIILKSKGPGSNPFNENTSEINKLIKYIDTYQDQEIKKIIIKSSRPDIIHINKKLFSSDVLTSDILKNNNIIIYYKISYKYNQENYKLKLQQIIKIKKYLDVGSIVVIKKKEINTTPILYNYIITINNNTFFQIDKLNTTIIDNNLPNTLLHLFH